MNARGSSTSEAGCAPFGLWNTATFAGRSSVASIVATRHSTSSPDAASFTFKSDRHRLPRGRFNSSRTGASISPSTHDAVDAVPEEVGEGVGLGSGGEGEGDAETVTCSSTATVVEDGDADADTAGEVEGLGVDAAGAPDLVGETKTEGGATGAVKTAAGSAAVTVRDDALREPKVRPTTAHTTTRTMAILIRIHRAPTPRDSGFTTLASPSAPRSQCAPVGTHCER